MTDHLHAEITPGCYRCELGRDEVDRLVSETISEPNAPLVEALRPPEEESPTRG